MPFDRPVPTLCASTGDARAPDFTRDGFAVRPRKTIKKEQHPYRKRSEYSCWSGIKQRCNNPNNTNYAYYGAAGITMCDAWANSFVCFLHDMGDRPSLNHTVDRIDNARGYEPGNCRWATKREQMQNVRNNHVITAFGETKCLAQWARERNIPIITLWSRLKKGIDPETAIASKKNSKGRSRLSDDDVRTIRSEFRAGASRLQLADRFNLEINAISRITCRKTHRDVI